MSNEKIHLGGTIFLALIFAALFSIQPGWDSEWAKFASRFFAAFLVLYLFKVVKG